MNLLKRFFKFVIPSIISMWVFSLYSMADGVFVAKGVGETALAAVNLSMPLTCAIFAVGLTFATGTSVLVSISVGKGDLSRANELFSQNITVMILVGILITALVQTNLEAVIRFLGATQDTAVYVREYAGVISLFAVFFIVSYNLEVLVKADGAPQISTIGVMSCAAMNVLLDYVFVMRFHWGAWGAALATGLAQVTSTIIFLIYFLKGSRKLRFKRFHFQLSDYKKILPLGIGEGISDLSNGIVIFLFNQVILSTIGEFALVSYTVISYINTFVLMTMTGTSQGLQPLLSFHHGRGEHDICRKLLKYGILSSAICGFGALIAVFTGAPGIAGFFIDRVSAQSLLEYTVRAMRIYSVSFLLIGYNVIAAGYFAAVEKPAFAMTISFGRGLVLIAASLFVLPMIAGDTGVWMAAGVSEAVCLVGTGVLAERGRHKKQPRAGSHTAHVREVL